MKHADQFIKTLKEITNYVQKKYSSDIMKIIKNVEHPIFNFPVHPVPRMVRNLDGITMQEKIDEMGIYIWKKEYELVHNKKADFTKKEKQVLPIILDQCSPSLRPQLEGAKTFEEAQKNDIVELLKLIRGFCCKHNQNDKRFCAVFNSLQGLFINFQNNDLTNDEYLKEFQVRMATLDDYDINIVGLVPCLVKETTKEMFGTMMDLATEDEMKKAKEYVLK